MTTLRAVQKLLIVAVVVIFAISAVALYAASKNLEVAMLMSLFNLLGSDLPASEALVDAPLLPVFLAQSVDIAGNIMVTILLTTFLYQLLGRIDIHKRVMLSRARKLSGHSIIVQKNSITMELADKLKSNRLPFVVIEKGIRETASLEKKGYIAISGEPTEEATLREAGIEKAHAIFLLGEDDIKNALIAMTAHKLNRRIKIAARIKRLSDIPKMQRVGVSHLVLSEISVGNEIGTFVLKASRQAAESRKT